MMDRPAEGMGTLERIFRTARRIRYAKNNSTAVPGRRPIHSVRCGWALLPLLYERRRQRFSYLHFRRSAALGALRTALGKETSRWGVGCFWAPECYEIDGIYYLFYSADWKVNPTGALENFRIGVARASTPSGPFYGYFRPSDF